MHVACVYSASTNFSWKKSACSIGCFLCIWCSCFVCIAILIAWCLWSASSASGKSSLRVFGWHVSSPGQKPEEFCLFQTRHRINKVSILPGIFHQFLPSLFHSLLFWRCSLSLFLALLLVHSVVFDKVVYSHTRSQRRVILPRGFLGTGVKLVGGRGRGMFITSSRKDTRGLQTGDEAIRVSV